jgi:hypothetical protein
MDKFAFARFSIPFVAVAVMHFDRNILSYALVRPIFYCKSICNYFSTYLGKSLALTAGLRIKRSSWGGREGISRKRNGRSPISYNNENIAATSPPPIHSLSTLNGLTF